MSKRLRLMYGGTFDPFHNGHLHIATWARDHANAEVFVTPAADPPHRDATTATATQRLDMVVLGIDDQQCIFADDRELRRDGPSYTYDTLAELRRDVGAYVPLGILLGADSFLSLPTWHRWQELTSLAHLVVADRPGQDSLTGMSPALAEHVTNRLLTDPAALTASPHGLVLQLRQPQIDISATQIRQAIAAGRDDWRSLVDRGVATYIDDNGLYR